MAGAPKKRDLSEDQLSSQEFLANFYLQVCLLVQQAPDSLLEQIIEICQHEREVRGVSDDTSPYDA